MSNKRKNKIHVSNNNNNNNKNVPAIISKDNENYTVVNSLDELIVQVSDLQNTRIAIGPGAILKTASMSSQLAVTDKAKQQLADDYVRAVLGPNVASNFENPYDQFMQWTQHDTYRRDGEVNRAVTLKAQFCLGENLTTILDVNRVYGTEEQNKRALSLISNEPQYQVYKSDIDTINQRCQLTDKMLGALVSAQVYGRGILQVDYDEDGLPIRLKPLNPMRVGRLFHDKDTWEIRGIEYLDYSAEEGQTLIKAQNMIYIPNKNFHISPNTYQHGYSDLEPITDVSETNRIINEIDLKESARRSWAPYVLVKFKRRNAKIMQDFISKFKEGRATATAEDVEVTVHEIPMSSEKLIMVRDANEKKIAAVVGVPTFLMGREDVTNRATAQSVLQAFDQSIIKQLRNWIKMILEDQWLKPLLLRLIQIKETVTGQQDEDILTPEALNPKPAELQQQQQKQQQIPTQPSMIEVGATPLAKTAAFSFPPSPPSPPNQQQEPTSSAQQKQHEKIQKQRMQQEKQRQIEEQKQQLEQRNKALNAFSAIEWQRQKRKAERQDQQPAAIESQTTTADEENQTNQSSKINQQVQTDGNGNGKRLPPKTIFPVDAEGDVEPEETDEAEQEGLPLGYYAEDLEFKVKIEFSSISFDTMTDLGPVIVQLKNAGILDTEASLELMHLDKYIDKMKLEEVQQQQQNKLYNEMMLAETSAMQQQQDQQGQGQQQNPDMMMQQPQSNKGLVQSPAVKLQQAKMKALAHAGKLTE